MDFSPQIGAEITKKRPCVVVSHPQITLRSSFFIVVPMSSHTQKALPFHLILEPSKINRLSTASKCLPEQIRSLDKTRYVGRLGRLTPEQLKSLEQKIAFVLNQSH